MGGTTSTITIAAPTAGDALVLSFASSSTNDYITGVTSGGTSWADAQQSRSGDGDAEIWYLANATAASTSVVITYRNTNMPVDLANVTEWAGVATSAALDGTGTATASAPNGTSVSAGSINPTATGDLDISAAYVAAGTTSQPLPTNGFSPLNQSTVAPNNYYLGYAAYYGQPDSNSISTTWTAPGSNRWSSVMAAFVP